ncbi:MAG: tRNA (adenosine(37)-N6)-threonylcarbamoyltransferase complex ATPase subunit type 1 TsaE [Phascolarctobacterium sp.]|nr:tRNA (adenosine(37)-N6)-threonylcarbamoyltransferase complex ATPase subunit type 1 TsaE [Phascolarctobacterium sp.]
MEIFLADSEATEALGRLLGKHVEDYDVLCLNGDLGAGKTLLSRGLATSLGVAAEDVTSPTFAIMNVYMGRTMEIHHFDLYRLDRVEELEDIGFAEYAGGEGVTLIEWAELFPTELPEEYLEIVLRHEGAGRKAVLTPHGKRYEELLEEVQKDADFGH